MKIYTRTGDKGTTGLFGGDRVSKAHPRITAYGTVDEANSVLGHVLASIKTSSLDNLSQKEAESLIVEIQNCLFVVGAELATPTGAKPTIPRISEASVTFLEEAIDNMETDLPPLNSFILPGGTVSAAQLHVARTVCRRAERDTIRLSEQVDIDQLIPIYLNRLSDLLFVFARWVNHKCGKEEIEWHPDSETS